MKAQMEELQARALVRIRQAQDEAQLQDARVAFLGKKGELTAVLRGMKDLSAAERPVIGALANEVRAVLEAAIDEQRTVLKEAKLAARLASERIDITLPGRRPLTGHIHPLTKINRRIKDIFMKMGYTVAEGPEMESDFYNFQCLNFPPDHPARDMQDSFYITDSILLRTHTSPVQARTMQAHEPNTPLRIIAPGKVFRWDYDATHSPVFHQVEGLVLDKGITFGDLKGTIEHFCREIFGSDTQVRFRASYFPFTEPSAEVDILFRKRHTKGSTVRTTESWLEILGCGMVHPNVLQLNGYDPAEISGFAFGMGVERIAMLVYGIDDLRLFFENDLRFLAQF
ncbi:MAG: phenylalanine--tRNA ligase subunit alpha [Veillonellaceae bacterium]|nr:phenylalanine--tRNA ligase subunit alpha [Veillonellaceae bacterium]